MKRCPQCDFIYEDDQSLCDMDGVLLVLDSRVLPNMHALAPIDAPVMATKSAWRHRTFPAVAALILATVFSLVYFVSTHRTVPSPVSGASVMPAAPEPAPVAESNPPSESNQAVPAPPVEQLNTAAVTREEERKPASTKASTTPSNKKASTTAPTAERKPAEDEKKDENKVGSILKKTGRILKKPFKF